LFPNPLTSFVGREEEIETVRQLLATTRLLTLTGPGGVGKTRLAIQAAPAALVDFEDGGCWVDLASLTDSTLVANAIAKSLGVQESLTPPLIDTITTSLHSRQMLLVLDNCEHLITSSAELVEHLLSKCPRLKILATSREELRVYGETTWHVPSLPFPETQILPPVQNLKDYASIKLFIERATVVRSGFAASDRNALAIATICQKLDGIPLAIELAAARIKLMSAEEIARHLVDRFSLLTDGSRTALPRQQTLRATIDWSYDLLAEPESLVFRRLSVFAASFTLEAAGEVACSEAQLPEAANILDRLAQLVSKSLVNVEKEKPGPAGDTRYRMLETIREYAREQLVKASEFEAVNARFLAYYLALAETARPNLLNQNQAEWLDRLEIEHDNIIAAIDWSLESKVMEGAELAWLLDRFWNLRGYIDEGEKWSARILARQGYPDILRAKLLLLSGHFARLQGKYELASAFGETGLAFFKKEDNFQGIAEAKVLLGIILVHEGKREEGLSLLGESLEVFRSVGDEWKTGRNLLFISDTYNRMGKNDLAATLCQECLSIFQKLGDPWGIAFAFGIAGEIARQQGRFREARDYFRKNLILHWQRGQIGEIPYPMETLAIIAISESDFLQGVRLWGAAQAHRVKTNNPLPTAYQSDYQKYLSVARDHLGETLFTTTIGEGWNFTLEEAIAFAVQDSQTEAEMPPIPRAVPGSVHPAGEVRVAYGLTKREIDVLRLVATGMTDAQVSERLFISPRTVNKHLQSIYGKLQVNSRTAAAHLALELQLLI
jgi:predicted ATPase/DNA-binding CsgD family transcriptional regulator